jgi:hypothetical protein
MTEARTRISRLRRPLVILAACLAATGFAGLATHELSVATAQAHGLVREGQTALQRGERARATVAFERARLLAPRAGFVHEALAAVQARQAESPMLRAVSWLGPREWSFLLVMFGWAVGLSSAVVIAQRSKAPLARRIAFVTGSLFALSAAGVLLSSVETRALSVVTNATGMLVAPYVGAGAAADMTPGMVVRTDSRYGDFVRVCGPSGAHGWIARSALEPVLGT